MLISVRCACPPCRRTAASDVSPGSNTFSYTHNCTCIQPGPGLPPACRSWQCDVQELKKCPTKTRSCGGDTVTFNGSVVTTTCCDNAVSDGHRDVLTRVCTCSISRRYDQEAAVVVRRIVHSMFLYEPCLSLQDAVSNLRAAQHFCFLILPC